MGSYGEESVTLEETAIEGGALEPLLGKVTDERILFRIEFQKGDACGAMGNGLEAEFQLLQRQVEEGVAADNQVVIIGKADFLQRGEGAEADVPLLSESSDGVAAGIDAGVADSGTERLQGRKPVPLTATGVQNGANRTFQIILGYRERECRLPADRGTRFHAGLRITIPPVEIGAIVSGDPLIFFHQKTGKQGLRRRLGFRIEGKNIGTLQINFSYHQRTGFTSPAVRVLIF
jgi:hypothetical protein